MARKGERIHLSVRREIKKDITERKNFNASAFFVRKYTDEFLNKKAVEDSIEKRRDELQRLTDRLAEMTGTEQVLPEISGERCPICTMFFNNDIRVRKRIEVSKGIHVCAQCNQEQPATVKKFIAEKKLTEEIQ